MIPMEMRIDDMPNGFRRNLGADLRDKRHRGGRLRVRIDDQQPVRLLKNNSVAVDDSTRLGDRRIHAVRDLRNVEKLWQSRRSLGPRLGGAKYGLFEQRSSGPASSEGGAQ